jgi:undecaprenyl-diphosphatase
MITLDTQLFFAFNSLAGQSPFLDDVIVFIASYLPYLVGTFFLGLVFFSAYTNREKIGLLFVGLGSAIIARFGAVEIIRFFYPRARPFDDLAVTQLLTSDNWSFPSGHASFFFALSTVVYLYNKKWGTGFFIATILLTLSRVIAGIHYPFDIVGGALVGGVVGYLVFRISRRG